VAVQPPEGGLAVQSFIKCEDVRCVSVQWFGGYLGRVASATMTEVEERL